MYRLLVFVTAMVFHRVQGFVPIRKFLISPSSTQLKSSFSITTNNQDDLSSNPSDLIFRQALDCSSSDTCSVDQAEWYLSELMALQKECSLETYIRGDENDMQHCQEPEVLSQLIVAMEGKVDKMRNSMHLSSKLSWITIVSTVITLAVIGKLMTSNLGGDDTVAFTAEEWIWALRDNYFPSMVVYFIRHGGLITEL
jgi:hypothetical protein